MMQFSTDRPHLFSLLQPLQFTMSTPISSRHFREKFKLDFSVNIKIYEGVRLLAQQVTMFGLVYIKTPWNGVLGFLGTFPSLGKCSTKKKLCISPPCIHPMIQVHPQENSCPAVASHAWVPNEALLISNSYKGLIFSLHLMLTAVWLLGWDSFFLKPCLKAIHLIRE